MQRLPKLKTISKTLIFISFLLPIIKCSNTQTTMNERIDIDAIEGGTDIVNKDRFHFIEKNSNQVEDPNEETQKKIEPYLDAACKRSINCNFDKDCPANFKCEFGLCISQRDACQNENRCYCDPEFYLESCRSLYCFLGACKRVQCKTDCDCTIGLDPNSPFIGAFCDTDGYCKNCIEICKKEGTCNKTTQICRRYGYVIGSPRTCSDCFKK